MWVMAIPVVVGVLQMFLQVWKKRLKELEIREGIKTIQTTALLRSAEIFRRVQETFCHSYSSDRNQLVLWVIIYLSIQTIVHFLLLSHNVSHSHSTFHIRDTVLVNRITEKLTIKQQNVKSLLTMDLIKGSIQNYKNITKCSNTWRRPEETTETWRRLKGTRTWRWLEGTTNTCRRLRGTTSTCKRVFCIQFHRIQFSKQIYLTHTNRYYHVKSEWTWE